ncbi:helix-turn-helix domain-containing protein [Streptomyces tsukubensis]|uniref:Transcriptional regulator n=1 Tax=Streptomyces tsukubensis TaxID=83656 RepID=A0A1V4A7A4_9ACTN|nr:helix-turn-helix transcriptional regulator [Streptomyces tsukubensis]OON77327.1 transcriptional regulator [Streptomyces tsukubensis]QFR92404.1 helix-turn-helix domain-containing protein [Streptomyces tsukubensis]
MTHGPAVRRRKLGSELRTLRGRAGLTSGQAAVLAGWHQSKVSRIETGRSGAKAEDVRRLLDVYGVRELESRRLLQALAGPENESDRHHWWYSYRELLPTAYRDFIRLEAQAGAMRTLETSVVPGLLQTRDYARAVTRAALTGLPAPLNDEQVDALVDVRLARQEVLHRESPLELTAVLDEAVLRRRVGGNGVMRSQLLRLLQQTELPNLRLQVLPFAAGEHVGITGPFVIFSFSVITDLDVVILDHLASSVHLEQREDIRAYGDAFALLQEHALSPGKSSDLIAEISDGA